MKKILCALIAFICLFLCVATADVPDVNNLSFEQLQALQSAVNDALWASSDWKSVSVPAGLYVVGDDIPAGRYTITCAPKHHAYIKWGAYENRSFIYMKSDSQWVYGDGDKYQNYISATQQQNIIVYDGDMIQISEGPAVFSPYVPAFTFE